MITFFLSCVSLFIILLCLSMRLSLCLIIASSLSFLLIFITQYMMSKKLLKMSVKFILTLCGSLNLIIKFVPMGIKTKKFVKFLLETLKYLAGALLGYLAA